jgi:hypothetical protein
MNKDIATSLATQCRDFETSFTFHIYGPSRRHGPNGQLCKGFLHKSPRKLHEKEGIALTDTGLLLANRDLIVRMEAKIKMKLSGIWGDK